MVRCPLSSEVEAATIKPGDSVLDIGCGSGVIDRMLTGSICPGAFVIATDLNAYLLREAEALAEADGLSGVIEFRCANAEQLPFAEGTFNVALCVTVLEECNAARALSEMYRILRPGGRAAIAVRAMDMQQWWNLELPEAIREKVERPKQTPGSGGVGDATIYRRVLEAGFAPIACFPFFLALDPSALTVWQFREDQATSALAVEPQEVVPGQAETADGCLCLQATMRPMPVVAVKPVG
jgi:SAM-dependent methyltransferase